MTTTLEKSNLTVLKRDPKVPSSMPRGHKIKVVGEPKPDIAAHWHNLFVLTTATCLGDVAEFVSVANKRNQLRALFVRCDVDPKWLPQMFEQANLRTMRNTIIHSDFQVPWRVLRAWQAGAQGELIADAKVIGDEIFVVSCEPETYRVPFVSVPALKRVPTGERSNFGLADDGSYLHWPARDVHLDLDALLVAIDPERRKRAEKVKHEYGQRYGEAIARLRSERGLRQSDIPGLSEREVRRIESGGQATVDSLRKLAAAHSMELADYLNELATLAGEHYRNAVADKSPSTGHSAVSYQVRKRK
jgi:hypothetical protein